MHILCYSIYDIPMKLLRFMKLQAVENKYGSDLGSFD